MSKKRRQPPQGPSITPQQVVDSATAGTQLFGLESTLIPGNLRKQIAVLEAVLHGIATGNLRVVPAPPNPVESGIDKGKPRKADDDGRDTTPDTEATPA